MSQYSLKLMVITTPEELERGKETYATLTRTIELPVQPYVGMSIFFNPYNITGERGERFLRLRETLNITSEAQQVESMCVFIGTIDGANPNQVLAHINIGEIFEPTLSQFKARIHLFEQYYGFERL